MSKRKRSEEIVAKSALMARDRERPRGGAGERRPGGASTPFLLGRAGVVDGSSGAAVPAKRPDARRRSLAALLATTTAVMSALAPAPVLANDSTAELTTGGLVFAKSASVEMRAEDLFVSDKEIRVRYRFFNAAPRDVTSLVAFPMPDIVYDGPDDSLAIPSEDPANFLDFQTNADGRPVAAELEQKALANGVDQTARLKALGVPLAPQLEQTDKALDALTPAQKAELANLKMTAPNDYDVGKGMEHHLTAAWTLKSTYFWRQTFPAGREIVIEHRYRPSVGETTGTQLGSPDLEKDALARYETTYCVDQDFLSAARQAMGKPDQTGLLSSPFFERRIAYILTTGANWAGPINDFHLVVDKGAADSLVSFCAEGVNKISATQFEVRHANFTPSRELHVLILYRPRL